MGTFAPRAGKVGHPTTVSHLWVKMAVGREGKPGCDDVEKLHIAITPELKLCMGWPGQALAVDNWAYVHCWAWEEEGGRKGYRFVYFEEKNNNPLQKS